MRAATPSTPTPRQRRRGFTLVELLVVIIIIGLLTGLLVTAISRSLVSSRDARMIAEIAQLDSAVKAYKEKFGGFPPAVSGNTSAVNAHVRRMFPRFIQSDPSVWREIDARRQGMFNAGNSPPIPASFTPVYISPAEALVFWLGGMPATGGSSKTLGFSLNPANPFDMSGGQRTSPLYEFDQSRLIDKDGNGYLEYYPPYGTLPYVYFDYKSYATSSAPSSLWVGDTTIGFAEPYRDAGTGAADYGFMNPKSFQIICAGQDDNYGNGDGSAPVIHAKVFPTNSPPAGYLPWNDGDLDNLTNFTTKRLEESLQ